jgi:hypothetical protein
MSWLFQLHDAHVVAHAIGVIALVCSAGMAPGVVLIGAGLAVRWAGSAAWISPVRARDARRRHDARGTPTMPA